MHDTEESRKQFESDILSYLSLEFPNYYDRSILEYKKESIKQVSSLFDDFQHISADKEKYNLHWAYKNASDAFKFDEFKKTSASQSCTSFIT